LVQVYNYYQIYKKDAIWNRILVMYLLIVETINTAADIGLVYEPLCLRWGSPTALQISPKMFPSDAILTAAIQVPCQLYYAFRIRASTKSILLPLIIVILSFVSLVGAITASVSISILPKFADFPRVEGAILTWLVSAAVTDLIITGLLVRFLMGLKKHGTGLGEGGVVVNKIILMTVQTGAVTATAATLDLVIFLGFPGTLNFVFDFALSKLYSNSLLSTLIARAAWNQLANKRKNPLSFIDVRRLGASVWDPEKNPIQVASPGTANLQVERRLGAVVRFPSEAHTSSSSNPSPSLTM